MLEGIELFANLTDSEKETLGLFCQLRNLEDNELLFSEDDHANAMYVVKSGALKVYRSRSSGTTVLGYVGQGEIVGEMALFGEYPSIRNASVSAVEPSVLLVIADYAVKQISAKHPDLLRKIQTTIELRKQKNSQK